MEIDESDLPELPTTAHRAAPPTHVPRPAGHVGAARANGTSRAASSGSASASASATGVSGRTASSGELATRARLAQRPPWGQNGSSKPAKAKPATSSSSRGASLSLLKREAAEAAARRDAAALDKLDKASTPAPARTQAQKSLAKRKGERNASVYNRLLRESRRSARAPRRREADGPRDALGERGKENDASAAGSLSSRPRAAHTGHTTTEDEDGGYWATTEPEDAWTTDANEEGPRSESRGRAGPGQATDDARRAWLDAGENPTASDADADAASAAAASPSVTSFPTPRPRGSSRALVDAEPDENERVVGEASETSEGEDEERASVASSSPGESSNRIVAEARAAASEDERPAAAAADDDDSASDSETDEDSFSSDVASLTLGSEDSFASASLEPEGEESEPESGESAGRDPHPDDVDVAATLREDNVALRSKLREAAAALAASARERAEAAEERERARKRAETRAAELASFRRDASRTEKTLRRSTEKAESKVQDAERRAKDAERRAKDAEKLAADAEARARTAMRLRESAAAAADKARKKSATLVADLERTNEALAQMTEAAEEARAEAKASLVWRVAREKKEGGAAEPPDRAGVERADAAAAESAARALAAAAAEAEAILVAGAEGADPLDACTPARATASGDDFGAARSLVSAARRAAVDAGLRAEELASLRSALTGEMAAARRAEREMAKLRAKLHDAEADAHAAWAALDVERARVAASKVSSESGTDGAEAAPAATPASASQLSAFNLLSLVSPSLTRSPGREAMETERAALDKVVAHLNARRARPERRGFAALERFGGGAGANADEATARRIAFFCFKFWQQLAATSATPGRASTPGTPGSFPHWTPSDEFAFDVDVGSHQSQMKSVSREEATRSTAAGPASPSPPHPPLPLPRWEPSAAAASDSPAMIDLRTPPLERWAKR